MSGYPHETLSYSSINEFTGYASCQRGWWYRRIANQPPDRPKGQQLALGTAFDAAAMAACEAKIAGDVMAPDDAIGLMLDSWRVQMDTGEYETGGENGSNLPGLAPSAVRKFVTEVVPAITPIATQHPIRLKFDEVDWEFVAKVDLLAESERDGYVDLLDTKATASSSTKYEPAADLQLNLYALTHELEGGHVNETGFIVARILKTKTEIRTPRAPHSQAAHDQALDLLNTTSKAIETACESGNFPPTAFLQRSWKCSERFCEFYPRTCDYGARARTTFAIPSKEDSDAA